MPNNIYVCFMCKKKFKDEEWLNGVTDYNICQDCIFQTNAVCYEPHTMNTINSINSFQVLFQGSRYNTRIRRKVSRRKFLQKVVVVRIVPSEFWFRSRSARPRPKS